MFKVRGSNNDGVWNNDGTELFLTIRPPFWNTAPAYFIYLIALFTVLNAIYRYFNLKTSYQRNLLKERLQRKKEEEIHQFKLRFFTNISHEFRTPLTLISGPLQNVLYSQSISKEVRTQLEVVFKNTTLLLQQINQLMDFRKLEAGDPKLLIKEKDVVAQIKERISTFTPIIKQHKLAVSFFSPFKEYLVSIDAGKLNSILNNLLSNAIKFSKPGGEIAVSLNEQSVINNEKHSEFQQIVGDRLFVPNEFFEIVVRDTGIGIEKTDYENIFQRYFQIKPKADTNQAGTGIGLAVVKSFIELHKGNLFIKSNKEMGTTFVIQFLKKIDVNTNKNSEISLVESELSEFDMRLPVDEVMDNKLVENNKSNLNVMVVDDNEDMLDYLDSILGNHFNVLKESDPLKGLDKVYSVNPDLIISDIMMPTMNGIEFCKKIKMDEKSCHIPIILLTARTSVESYITGYETGADAYITKPFNQEILIAQICNLINKRNQLKKVFSRRIEVNPQEVTMNTIDEKFLKKALAFVEENMANTELNTSTMCKHMGMSRTSLHVKLKALTDLSTTEFIRTIRLKRAKQLLDTGGYGINEIVYQVGFNSPSYFTKCFKDFFGTPPTQIQNKTL